MKFEDAAKITTPFGLKPDYDPNDVKQDRLTAKRGPSRWGDPDLQFGPQHDYEIEWVTPYWVFWPKSEAGREWAYAHFPEDAPRFGLPSYKPSGFIIDKWQDVVRKAAARDGLMSLEEFEEAMQENEELMRQGDDN